MGNKDLSGTVKVNVKIEKDRLVKDILLNVKELMNEKGYNPVNQIVGYIMSGDPTYITSYKDARNLLTKIDRDELLEEIIQFYYENNK